MPLILEQETADINPSKVTTTKNKLI